MMLTVCITAGTAQRTFSSDLNREHWSVASQDAAPSYQQFPYRESRFGLPLRLVLHRRLSVVTCKLQHAASPLSRLGNGLLSRGRVVIATSCSGFLVVSA